ncbi:hypothetical protein WUBG_06962 [Wuchereria bancrofti]|uniref:Uncharacterized protein n=1 Tax=Wuchereria bancrofti TaxID=6293 RepID=J9EY49_WUCBA|nr:hypothetical protein WUBG_06962 [Wuchereria bancrofti]
MPKQEFEFIDYLGPLAVSVCFVIALFILSAIINFIWITKNDDRTVFEKFGSTFDLRCGVHRMRHRPNKWPLLTYTFAILELEPIKMFSTILTNLEELATNVDPQRCEMYEEMVMNLRINENYARR